MAKTVLRLVIIVSIMFYAGMPLVNAQEFGGNPPAIKWRQVNTPAARVIFPTGLDSAGIRVAAMIARMNDLIKPTIGNKQRQINIVLQNQTTISNAYVGLAPFRSEFYLTPAQNSFGIGSLYWPDQLAIHEFRHVQQYNNFNVGGSRLLHILFGEGGQAVGNELSLPNWFFEGDAVFIETFTSRQGRGRIPYFFNGYKALWIAGKNYSYMKLRNGSYRDYTPDHYPLGYMLVSYGRQNYGDDFWKNVTHDAASFDGFFYPFPKAVKKYSGIGFTAFRNNALNNFRTRLAGNINVSASNKQHFVADEEYPAFVDDNTIIYLKSTYQNRPVFVRKTAGKEKVIRVRDLSIDDYFAYRAGKIVYAAYQPDVRWGYREYNDLRILDVNTGTQKEITHRAKYFSPDLSSDGKQVVAVHIDPNGQNELHILNADNGTLTARIPNLGRVFYTYPKFYNSQQLIAAVRKPNGEMAIARIEVATGKTTYLQTPGYQPVGFPAVHGDRVYFSATSGENDVLFALSVTDGMLYKVKNPDLQQAIGNYQPALSAHKLAWVSQTADGYRLHETDQQNLSFEPVTSLSELSDFGVNVLQNDAIARVLTNVNGVDFPVTKYHKAFHLFNFHSLFPEFNDPNYTISLVGENVLNTLQTNVLFNYNRDEGYKEFGVSAIYGALFPYLSAGANYIADRRAYTSKLGNVYWNETELYGGAQIPFNFTHGRHITGLNIGTNVVYNSTMFQSAFTKYYADRNYTYTSSFINFSNRISQARQNIYPRFAQTITFNYKNSVTNYNAHQLLITGALYFPGLVTNHSLVLTGAYQARNQNSVIGYSNNFPFSRGYTAENFYSLEKAGANYHFPISYPDRGFGDFIYFMRIRGNLFYDHTHASGVYTNGNGASFRSTGGEVYFDTKWFNQVPITLGIRYGRLLDRDLFGGASRDRIELVVPLSFF